MPLKTRAPPGADSEQEITQVITSRLVFIGNLVTKATGAGASRSLLKTKGHLKLSQ